MRRSRKWDGIKDEANRLEASLRSARLEMVRRCDVS